MNYLQARRDGPVARAATVLGCTEGRVYTLAIGLVLAVVLAAFGWPGARTELVAADLPVPGTGSPLTVGSALPDLPPLSTGTTGQPGSPGASTTATPPGSPSTSIVDLPSRDPGYLLPPELRGLEVAVANLVRDGCSRLSLINVVLGLVPELKEPVEQTQVLRLLSEVYVACDTVPFPPTRIVCALDRQINAVLLQSPLGLFLQSLPPVIGHAVELLTAPTAILFGPLRMSDPLLKPLLMQQLGCAEVEQ